jgi:hypothetical protein
MRNLRPPAARWPGSTHVTDNGSRRLEGTSRVSMAVVCANVNELALVRIPIRRERHADMPVGINCLRAFGDRHRFQGGRTLEGADVAELPNGSICPVCVAFAPVPRRIAVTAGIKFARSRAERRGRCGRRSG